MLKKCGTFREQRWWWFIYKLKLIKQLKVAEENEQRKRDSQLRALQEQEERAKKQKKVGLRVFLVDKYYS